jgi:tetratricopeptide (TPR) repeat protein
MLSKAIELKPNFGAAYNNRGNIYASIYNKYSLALSDFTKAIDINPKNTTAYKKRAHLYRQIGKIAEAEADEIKIRMLERQRY